MASCIIFDRDQRKFPYSQIVNVRTKNSDFILSVTGKISASPFQFAINILENKNILFHMNPRWSEARTVFNTCSVLCGWGQPEYAFFKSLTPNATFTITITSANNQFKVQVNNEPAVFFHHRIKTECVSRGIMIDKIANNDIAITLVKLDVLN